jgi:alkylation response protein AidB-like acyl-CoA dehydrogenase
MDPYELRRQDFSLDDDQEAVRDAFAGFFAKECPTSVVRAAEPLGHDPALWTKLAGLGVASMALPETAGGDGAGIVELSLVAEEAGRSLAPVPLLEHVVAARLLAAAATDEARGLLERAADGTRLLGLALGPLNGPRLVSTAAVADAVVALDGDQVVVLTARSSRPHVPNQSCLPYAWVDPADLTSQTRTVLAPSGGAGLFDRAAREWKTLAAASLIGLTEAALALAVDFVKTRKTMGVVIATLQGVSFPLADVAIGIAGGRNLCRRAAWFLDHEPDSEQGLQAAALAYAAKVATHGTTTAQHAQGGMGFTVEADASLYFLRAKGWALGGGDPQRDVTTVGELRLAAAGPR